MPSKMSLFSVKPYAVILLGNTPGQMALTRTNFSASELAIVRDRWTEAALDGWYDHVPVPASDSPDSAMGLNAATEAMLMTLACSAPLVSKQ